MKNKFLKPTLALALALSIVGPGAKTTFASERSVSETSTKTSKEIYQETYNSAITRLEDIKWSFDGSLNDLKETLVKYSPEKVKSFSLESEFHEASKDINSKLSQANTKYANLSGKVVNTKELNDLYYDNSTFKQSDSYKNASLIQQNAYNNAIDNAKIALSKFEKVSISEYDQSLKALKYARESILETEGLSKAEKALKVEIAEANQIDKTLYTEKSYLVFKKALVSAQTTANSTNSTKEQYQASLEALRAAKDSLVKGDSKKDKELKSLVAGLKKSLKKHETQAQALRYLLDTKPKTIKSVKPKLEKLLKQSDELVKETQKFLAEVENVKG